MKQADEPGRSHDDRSVFERINALAREEHELWERESSGEVTDADRKLLEQLQVLLDQCWDLLHQRRALRSAGLDPDSAEVRDPKIVERYTG
jgi:hypothetical protein